MAYYQHDLALVHARGYGQHADNCTPGILDLLRPVAGGLVLELGCGAGALTRHLLAAGHRVIEGAENFSRVDPDWAIITEYSTPAPDVFVRDITTFVADGAGAWRRSSEHHENVLVDTSRIPGLLAGHGVDAVVRSSFGTEELPPGLRVVTGLRR